MNRALLPCVKSLFVAMLAVSGIASANTEAPKAVKADVAKGALLFSNGDNARGLPACVSCHGEGGNSTIAINPKLAGQGEAYLLKQLDNYSSGERAHAVMSTYAKMLTPAEKKDIAAYLSAQTQKPGAAKDKDTVEMGKKIYRAGIAAKGVPACASCHGAGGAGMPSQYPRVGSQHQDYTFAQLAAFKSGARKNSVPMMSIAERMSEAEMKAVSDYIAGLK